MNKHIFTLFLLSGFTLFALRAQKPYNGLVSGEKVPLYCASTGSSSADSTRLPVLFQARINGLTPGASYKYFARFITLSDTSSTSTTGAGISIFMKKNGNWRTSASPDINTGGAHDTFSLTLGQGEYTGWFGAMLTNDARFTPGNYIYPLIVLEEIGSGAMGAEKIYLTDSIEVLGYSATQGSGYGTAVYGNSFTRPKSMVLLYDVANGATPRPVTVAYTEGEGFSFSNMQTWYGSKVNGVSGAWGTILPNDLNSGILRIESRDPGFDTVIYANTELDGIWGNDSTMNRRGGAVRPVVIKSDFAPLLRPELEFVGNLTTLTEKDTVINLVVRRRYGNHDSTKVSAFVVAGTATNGSDYTIQTSFPLVFPPYGLRTDTIKVRILDDFSSEPTENVAIRLNNPVNGRIGFQTTFSIDIKDNDIPVVSFDKRTVTVSEKDGALAVKLRINSGSTSPTDVLVAVKSKSDSTFIPGDFKIGNSNTDTTVRFPGGNVTDSLEFNIYLVNELLKEDRPDTVTLVLRNPTSPARVGADSLFTLIIEDDDAPPVYRFKNTGLTINENGGSVKFKIMKSRGNINQSDIILSYSPATGNAQAGTDFTFTTQLLQFTNPEEDSLEVTVPIINDNLSEPREDAVFYIRSSFNATIAKPDTFRVTILDDDLPEYPISRVTASKAPAFVPDSLNVACAVRGIVYGVNMGPVGSPQGLSFTLIDNTGGIQVYKPNGGTMGYSVTEGDSIQVYGRIGHLNGMAQITQLDTIIKLGSGRPLKQVSVPGVLSEATESDLVRFNMVKLANPAQWPAAALAPNTSVTVKILTQSDSFNIIIDSETDIDGKAAPTGFFNLTGIGGQIDGSSPYNSGYVLYPRRMSDFANLVVPVFSFQSPTSTARENRDSTDGFILQCANLTSNQQVTLAIKGGTASRNVDYQSNATRLFILTQAQPSIVVKSKLNDDGIIEPAETIIWVIRGNSWGTLIGADSIHTVSITDDESTGLTEKALQTRIRVYPNPAKEGVYVTAADAQIQYVIVSDLNGREVARFDAADNGKVIFAAGDFASGLYNLTVVTDKGTIVKKLSILNQ